MFAEWSCSLRSRNIRSAHYSSRTAHTGVGRGRIVSFSVGKVNGNILLGGPERPSLPVCIAHRQSPYDGPCHEFLPSPASRPWGHFRRLPSR